MAAVPMAVTRGAALPATTVLAWAPVRPPLHAPLRARAAFAASSFASCSASAAALACTLTGTAALAETRRRRLALRRRRGPGLAALRKVATTYDQAEAALQRGARLEDDDSDDEDEYNGEGSDDEDNYREGEAQEGFDPEDRGWLPPSGVSTMGRRNRPLWSGIADELVDFGGMPVPRRLKEALINRGAFEASGIQYASMGRIAAGEHVILHAPTGSGKTWAFLIPLLARLEPTLRVGIQLLILSPTAELALQLTAELRWLIDVLAGNERSCWFNPQVPRELAVAVLLSKSALWDAISQDTAVLVSTPRLIRSELAALEYQANKFAETLSYWMCANIHMIALDEVDALFTRVVEKRKRDKPSTTYEIIEFIFDVIRHRYRNRDVQVVCASATGDARKVRRNLEMLYLAKLPKPRDIARRPFTQLVQDQLTEEKPLTHRWLQHVIIPKGITHTFSECEVYDERFGQVRIEHMVKIALKLTGTVLFLCPEAIKLDAVVFALHQAGIREATKHHYEVGLGQSVQELLSPKTALVRMPRERGVTQSAQMKLPVNAAISGTQALADTLGRGERKVLVAKADKARGVHLEGVSYVVLLQLPALANDYLHQAGRTGRAGRSGTVISIVTPKERAYSQRSIESRLGIEFAAWDIEKGAPCYSASLPSEAFGSKPREIKTAIRLENALEKERKKEFWSQKTKAFKQKRKDSHPGHAFKVDLRPDLEEALDQWEAANASSDVETAATLHDELHRLGVSPQIQRPPAHIKAKVDSYAAAIAAKDFATMARLFRELQKGGVDPDLYHPTPLELIPLPDDWEGELKQREVS